MGSLGQDAPVIQPCNGRIWTDPSPNTFVRELVESWRHDRFKDEEDDVLYVSATEILSQIEGRWRHSRKVTERFNAPVLGKVLAHMESTGVDWIKYTRRRIEGRVQRVYEIKRPG